MLNATLSALLQLQLHMQKNMQHPGVHSSNINSNYGDNCSSIKNLDEGSYSDERLDEATTLSSHETDYAHDEREKAESSIDNASKKQTSANSSMSNSGNEEFLYSSVAWDGKTEHLEYFYGMQWNVAVRIIGIMQLHKIQPQFETYKSLITLAGSAGELEQVILC